MSDATQRTAGVERLFPFLLRARCLIVGREALARSRKKLEFVLITTDLSELSRSRIMSTFALCPIVQHYTSADVERHFGFKGTKVLGFRKSSLARSVYSEMKQHKVATIPGAAKGLAAGG